MKHLLVGLNLVAVVVILALGVRAFISPRIAMALYRDDYKGLMSQCDHAMREHFVAKQIALASTTEATIRNLDTAEVGLLSCHDYDRLRKTMIEWGVTENELALIGLDAIEEHADDVRQFVDIHEIRY